jgi:hypothetical protein
MVGDGEGRRDISGHSQGSPPDGDAALADAQRSANLATGRIHHVAQDGPIAPVEDDYPWT